MKGLIHIYYGYGKGKTTAAMGLAMRAAGCGKSVAIVQFLKGCPTGELNCLNKLGVSVFRCDTKKWVKDMTEAERNALFNAQTENLKKAAALKPDVLILDEVIDAKALNTVDISLLKSIIAEKPEQTELVLTGHTRDEELFSVADYITEMKKERHPFDRGIQARKGIEF